MKKGILIFLSALICAMPCPCGAVDSIIYNFKNSDGTPASYGSLILASGDLYGMTVNGGSAQAGSIFRMNLAGRNYGVIHDFTSNGPGEGGSAPLGSLVLDGAVLYGMTSTGGLVPENGPVNNGGTLFKINVDGSGFEILHGFNGSQLMGSNDGASPHGAVTVSGTKIFGMTRFGGAAARGTIFSLNTDGSGFSLLHSFAGGVNDGAAPEGSLILVGTKLYGMTNGGGSNDKGTVFSMNTDGSGFALLYSFGVAGSGDAMEPIAGNGLTAVDNRLYGMTFFGGALGNGAIFSLNTDGTNYQLVHSLVASDGAGPFGALTLCGSQLYGTTNGYGAKEDSSLGSLFSMSLDGRAFTVLHVFAGAPDDGGLPTGDPIPSMDESTVYAMTQFSGSNNNGSIFSAPATGSLTNAKLFSLVPSVGATTSVFDGRNTRYTLFVSDSTTSLNITPTTADPDASVMVNGSALRSGALSSLIGLNTGTNVIDAIITARDGVTSTLYTLNVVRLTPLQNWRMYFFGTPANAGYAANTADYVANGIPNLAKYAFGLNPLSPPASQIPLPFFGGNAFGFNFDQPEGISGIAYGAESALTLAPSSWTPVPDSGSGASHSFSVPTTGLAALFIRLKVTVPLTPVEQLGRNIFFDSTLSNPPGVSCASCHSPAAGFTGPSSDINRLAGPVPGAIADRSGSRKPQAISYSTFSPSGPYFDNGQGLWSGGNFWDGHAPTNAAQARMPFIGPNEMANTVVGSYPPHAGGYSPQVVQNLSQRPYAALFRQVFGTDVFETSTDDAVYSMTAQALAAYEASEEVNPFSSKFDASVHATPPANSYQFTPSEQNGRQLFFAKAQCFACHSSAPLDSVSGVTLGREVFTMYCYASIGTPKNPDNPFYQQQDAAGNPYGYNPQGAAFIDYGLGSNPNPAPGGTQFMSATPGDIAAFRGLFKAPSLRNVDMRPTADFVKSYMHNGVFKSLEEVVHFYNKRNIAVNASGQEIAFDLRDGPPPGYTALFPPPEVMDNVQNVAGLTPIAAPQVGPVESNVATNGQIGHLNLSPQEEIDLVNFLKTLTDGFSGTAPTPASQ
jgi:uncharacterized repeat protein (TIGR03803 family)